MVPIAKPLNTRMTEKYKHVIHVLMLL